METDWSKDIFAKNLKMYMAQAEKNQKEMADIVGVSAPTFHAWLNAKKMPRMDKVQKLADYFGIKKSDLIERKELEAAIEDRAAFDVMIAKNEDLREMLKMFMALPEDKKKTVKQMVADYYHAFADGR